MRYGVSLVVFGQEDHELLLRSCDSLLEMAGPWLERLTLDHRSGRSGRMTIERAALPGRDSTHTRPRCRSATRATMARPSPSPAADPGVGPLERLEDLLPVPLGDPQPVVPDEVRPESGRRPRRPAAAADLDHPRPGRVR